METGHFRSLLFLFLFFKKGSSFNCNIVLLPAAISLLSEGDIVCEANGSFRRHLNPLLCYKSPCTSIADVLGFVCSLRKSLHVNFYGIDVR